MISTATVVNIAISILCAVVSGTVLWKIQQLQKEHEKSRQENIAAAVKDRELQLATAEITELIARKIDGEGINGELHAAAHKLTAKREAVEQYTRVVYFAHKEGGSR